MMIGKMGGIWQPGKGMDVEEAHPGLFVFRFFHPLDVQNILKQGPWSFDNHTLILNILPDDADPREVSLFKVPFWIRVHDLPNGFMSQSTGKNIGNYIGEFLEYDEKNDSLTWRKYMRIRVLVDVRLPLKRFKKIKKPGGESKLVTFRYERLGTFCYICGLLGHSETKCPKLFDMTDTKNVTRGWSPELRAEMGRRQGGESRWLRQAGDANWVAPNPIVMSNNCSNKKSGNNGIVGDQELNANDEGRVKGPALSAMLMWTIWWRRNQKCWNDQQPTVFHVIRRARDTLQDWLQVQSKQKTQQHGTAMTVFVWEKPARGMLKCNVDIACYNEQNYYGVGACIRDENGNFVKAYMKKFNGRPLITEAEAYGILHVLFWLHESNTIAAPIVIESDCLHAVQAINSRQRNNTEFGTIIDKCRSLLVSNENCSISYVRRQANRVAHDLAQASRFYASPQVFNHCPSCIEPIIINEMH